MDVTRDVSPETEMPPQRTTLLPKIGDSLTTGIWSVACGEEQMVQNVADFLVMRTKAVEKQGPAVHHFDENG